MTTVAISVYREDFKAGPGGWIEILGNGAGNVRAHQRDGDGGLLSGSPWWIDYNHAPPGGGYLHLLYCLHTNPGPYISQEVTVAGGSNRFIEGGFPLDFTNAKVSVTVRGEVEMRGAECVWLIQARTADVHDGRSIYSPFILTGQPLRIAPEYSRQTVTFSPDEAQWKCLGSRHDRLDSYGWGSLNAVLKDVNCDVMLVMYLPEVHPLQGTPDEMHRRKAGADVPVDHSRLSQGWVALREVEIEFQTP